MGQYETLLYHIEENVGVITLNRPDVGNALSRQMSIDFMNVIGEIEANADVRAAVITGNGRLFFAGGDLAELAAAENQAAHFKEMTLYFHGAISRMSRMNAPVIAAVNGTAGGAGMSLTCACDLVVAADVAKFTMAYTRAGLSPDGSGTYFLPRIIGLRRALELTLTNRVLSAEEAQAWGIVNQVVGVDEVLPEAMKLAKKLANGPTLAFGASKRLMHSSFVTPLESQMEQEALAIAALTESADGKEGVAAFLEKRKAQFSGK